MKERTARTFISILRDDLQACDEVELVRDCFTIQSGWEHEYADFGAWWFVDSFIEDIEHKARLRRMVESVRAFFVDLARLSDAPVVLDDHLIEQLQRRILKAAYPSAWEIATGVKKHSAQKASDNIKRYLTEAEINGA